MSNDDRCIIARLSKQMRNLSLKRRKRLLSLFLTILEQSVNLSSIHIFIRYFMFLILGNVYRQSFDQRITCARFHCNSNERSQAASSISVLVTRRPSCTAFLQPRVFSSLVNRISRDSVIDRQSEMFRNS